MSLLNPEPAETPTEAPATEAPATEAPPTTETSDWRASLPDDLKNEPSLQVFKDPSALAKSYVHAQKQIGADKIVLPNPKYETPEDWNEIYNKLGRPESPDKYELEVKENMDERFVEGFKEAAHKSGLRPQQVEGLFGWYQEQATAMQEAHDKQAEIQRDKQITELKNEWGQAFDTRTQDASTLFKKYVPEDVQAHMDKMGYSNDPLMVKAFATLADKFLSEGDRVGADPSGHKAMSPSDAQAEIDNIWKDPNHPYHKGNEQARAEMDRLYEIATRSR
jgi:hypothetical protein